MALYELIRWLFRFKSHRNEFLLFHPISSSFSLPACLIFDLKTRRGRSRYTYGRKEEKRRKEEKEREKIRRRKEKGEGERKDMRKEKKDEKEREKDRKKERKEKNSLKKRDTYVRRSVKFEVAEYLK